MFLSKHVLCAALILVPSVAFSQDPSGLVSEDDILARPRKIEQRLNMGSGGCNPTPEERITNIEEKLKELQQQLAATVQLTGELAKKSGGNVFGTMQKDSDLRKEFFRVTHGTINFYNWRGTDQFLFVNGVRWRVLPGRSYIEVPYAPVSISLEGTPYTLRLTEENWAVDNAGRFYSDVNIRN